MTTYQTSERFEYCRRTMSSDAFAEIVTTYLKERASLSAIRLSDGERSLMIYADTGEIGPHTWLRDAGWIKRYGLTGADLKAVGCDLKRAAADATYVAPAIAGLHSPMFDVYPYVKNRTTYIENFFPSAWEAHGLTKEVLAAAPVCVLHRDHERIAKRYREKYKLSAEHLTSMSLDSWRDHAAIRLALRNHPSRLVCLSGGASGRVLAVDLANETGKVVLDIGEAADYSWCS